MLSESKSTSKIRAMKQLSTWSYQVGNNGKAKPTEIYVSDIGEMGGRSLAM